ncbi:MAG: hypothetical protein J6Y64_06875 [Ruminococcus sp.]|nr:hypothetical protein [Ruminococcus sp.]
MIGVIIGWAAAIVIFLIGRYIGRREIEQKYQFSRLEAEPDEKEKQDYDNNSL